MVDVQQRALRAFEQHAATGHVVAMDLHADVSQHGQDLLGSLHGLVVDRLEFQGLCLEVAFQREIVQGQQLFELGSKTFWVLQVLNAQGATRDLVFVSGANALPCGADLAAATAFTQSFTSLVDGDMERQDQRA